jgi:hypothetical protein
MANRCRAIVHSADRNRKGGDPRPDAARVQQDFQVPGDVGGETDDGCMTFIEEVTIRVARKLQARRVGPRPTSDSACDELVFVICSFDPEMDPVFDAITAAAAAVGLRAERVKDVQGDYRITDKILALLRTARLIVADLSRERPNVYFELGYARGLSKTVVTILRSGTNAHFDVRDWAYIEYIDSRPLEHQLRERFLFELQPPCV